MDQPRWLGHAWAHLGAREIAGARHNPRVLAFFKDAGHGEILRDETAWCAAFVGACLERSGLRSTRSLMARSYLKWGVDAGGLENAFGAVAVLSRGSNPALGHVGFLVGESPGKVWLLGGNQKDAVSVSAYDRSRLLGLRWVGSSDGKVGEVPSRDALFEIALTHVLKMEGGYTNDPVDPGGPTNMGVTLGVYAAWSKVALNGRTRARLLADLKAIPDESVREIYEVRYWRPASCVDFPDAIALMHFDTAVNHGVGTAIRMLQTIVGVDVDGEVGPDTRAAVRARPVGQVLRAYAQVRRERYRSLKHFWRFGRGWLRRVDATLQLASAVNDSGGTRERPKQGGGFSKRSSGMLISGRQGAGAGTKWWGRSVTIWGALITAAATVVPALAPLTGLDISAEAVRQVGSETLSAGQALMALAGTALAIFGRVRATESLVQRSVNFQL